MISMANTGILSVFLLPNVWSTVIFSHINQPTTDIRNITLPANVEEAWLHDNSLGVDGIPATYFQNFPSLSKIWLYVNQLNDFPDFCFSGIAGSLTFLDLAANNLTEIRKNQLAGLNLMEGLLLHENKIQMIEKGKYGMKSM